MNTSDVVVFDDVLDSGGSSNVLLPPPRGYSALCLANLLLSSIAIILSVILVLALTVPLLYPERRKRYSTYNLYLAFVALADLISHGLFVYLLLTHQQWSIGSYFSKSSSNNNNSSSSDANGTNTTNQPSTNHHPVWMFDIPWEIYIQAMTTAANLYLNAFLIYELYKLLANSNKRKKHRPPTLGRVIKQALISYGLGIIAFFVAYGVNDIVGDKPLWNILYHASLLIYCAVIPLSIAVYFTYKIVRQELLVSTGSMYDGRLRILVVYFARIIGSDLLLWIPGATLYFVSQIDRTKILTYNASLLLTGSQSIVLFVCSTAKPDVRQLLSDLVCRCVYFGRREGCNSRGDCDSRAAGYDPYLVVNNNQMPGGETTTAPKGKRTAPTIKVMEAGSNRRNQTPLESPAQPDEELNLDPNNADGLADSDPEDIDPEV